jgi:outer membrane protein
MSQCGAVRAAAPPPLPKAPPPCAVQVSREAKIRKAELLSPVKVLTVDDAIHLGLTNQPTVREAQAQFQISAGAVSVSGSALRPSVTVNASQALLGTQGRGNLTNNGAVSQLLYDFGRSRSALTSAEQTELSNYYALMAASADVVFSVKQAYYTLLEDNRLVEVFKENLKDQNAHVDQAQARLTVGVGPRADLLTAQASAASASVDLIHAQRTAELALVSLNAAMGVDVRSQTQIKDSAEPDAPVPLLNDAVMQAITNRPEVAQSVESVNAAVYSLKSAKTGNYPVLSGVANGQETLAGGSLTNGWQLALNLQWTPFDFGRVGGQITEAQGQLLLTEEQLYATRQSVSQDATSARLNIIAAQAELVSSKAEVASATENLDVATGRYEAGIGIFIQVTDAQSLLLKAEVDEATAQYGLSIARAELEHAVGAVAAKGLYQ